MPALRSESHALNHNIFMENLISRYSPCGSGCHHSGLLLTCSASPAAASCWDGFVSTTDSSLVETVGGCDPFSRSTVASIGSASAPTLNPNVTMAEIVVFVGAVPQTPVQGSAPVATLGLPVNYIIEFDVTPTGPPNSNWASIIHINAAGHARCLDPGCRIPGVWFYPNSFRIFDSGLILPAVSVARPLLQCHPCRAHFARIAMHSVCHALLGSVVQGGEIGHVWGACSVGVRRTGRRNGSCMGGMLCWGSGDIAHRQLSQRACNPTVCPIHVHRAAHR